MRTLVQGGHARAALLKRPVTGHVKAGMPGLAGRSGLHKAGAQVMLLNFRLNRQDKAAIHIRFEPEAGLISFLCEGVVSQADLHAAQAEADRIADGRSVRAMMIDARRSSPGYAPGQLVEPMSAILEDLGIQRCAFVTTRGRDEILDVIETVTFPYAVRVRAFESDAKARAWLLG